jgi:tetratricopeptide (TPR) repeat protein
LEAEMAQEDPSFWTDIKKYEDTLERDPNSYCFAPLSELYRKLGMVDDAIIVAKRGCEIHPEYVGGYMALGRAYLEKGMNAESREALERVVRVTPDNLLAQRILSKIYIDAGEVEAAEESLKTILSQNPDDSESRILLNSLIRIGRVNSHPAAESEGETGEAGIWQIENSEDEFSPEEEFEELIELEESDIFQEIAEEITGERDEEGKFPPPEQQDRNDRDFFDGGETERKDPLTTVTLAGLYVSQGFPKRALTIYRELLEADPENIELKNRLAALELEIDTDGTSAGEQSLETDAFDLEAGEADETSFAAESPQVQSDSSTPIAELRTTGDCHAAGSREEHIIHTLEMWLENIRRMR